MRISLSRDAVQTTLISYMYASKVFCMCLLIPFMGNCNQWLEIDVLIQHGVKSIYKYINALFIHSNLLQIC